MEPQIFFGFYLRGSACIGGQKIVFSRRWTPMNADQDEAITVTATSRVYRRVSACIGGLNAFFMGRRYTQMNADKRNHFEYV
jgi:hypothetical protein